MDKINKIKQQKNKINHSNKLFTNLDKNNLKIINIS